MNFKKILICSSLFLATNILSAAGKPWWHIDKSTVSTVAKDFYVNFVSDNTTPLHCIEALGYIIKYAKYNNASMETKKDFEQKRQFILENSDVNLQFFITYLCSAMFKIQNNYSDEEWLEDFEKAYIYQGLIWGNSLDMKLQKFKEISEPYIDINIEFIHEKKNIFLEKLASNKQVDRLNYWNSRFARSKQQQTELAAVSGQQELEILLTLINHYEYVQQTLLSEESKPLKKRDQKLIALATQKKIEIEQKFDISLNNAKNTLSLTDRQKLPNILNDGFMIPPNAMKQFSEILPADMACIQILPTDNNLIVYVITKDIPPFAKVVNLKDKVKFANQLRRLRDLLQKETDITSVQEYSQEIYQILFEHLEPALLQMGIKKLIINASGKLRYIPFAALYDGTHYLVEKYQISNITAIDLIRLSKNSQTRDLHTIKVAVFADPDKSSPLPAGRKEGNTIARFFNGAEYYLGKEATLERFQALLGNINFIHLATHAKLDADHPELSYIQFANGQRWTYSNMLGFNIRNVDSIVLSACSTAVKPTSDGGEIESMAYQLLRNSPAGSILASFWKVEDTATADFMVEYYQHIINSIKKNHTLDRGGALRQAQLTLLKNPKTSHPYYWAAFTLFGDFR